MTEALQGVKVLVVEDEYLVAILIEEILEAAGCVVMGPIPRLQEALDAVGHDDYDAARRHRQHADAAQDGAVTQDRSQAADHAPLQARQDSRRL